MDKKLLKDIAILFGVIIIAAIGARILAGGETLSDYAAKDPEAAGIVSTAEASTTASTKEKDIETTNPAAEASKDSSATTKEYTAAAKASSASSSSESTTASSAEVTSEASSESTTESPTTSSSKAPTEASTQEEKEIASERVTYQDGFYYEPISNEIFKRISGISYPVDCTVPLDDLRYVVLQYVDFNGESQSGEMICGKSIAQDVVEIFYELYTSGYQIERIRLVDEYGGDDTASMLANNTSCFNYRVVEGTTRLSNHARGVAIDLNPFYNPYITYNKDGTTNISPEGSEAYADRSAAFPYKIDENDLAYKLFKAHGFRWGGDWNSSKDYQHFDKK